MFYLVTHYFGWDNGRLLNIKVYGWMNEYDKFRALLSQKTDPKAQKSNKMTRS